MKQEDLIKLVKHIEIPIDIVKQSEMLKNEYLHTYILELSNVRPDESLFLIKKYDLEKEFDIKKIIGKLVNKGNYIAFEIWVEELGLDKDKKWLKNQIQKIINKKELFSALSLINTFNLKDKFNVKELIENCFDYLEKYDYDIFSIIEWIKSFGLDEDKEWLKKLVQKIIDKDELLNKTLIMIKSFGLKEEFDIKELIEIKIKEKDFNKAYFWIREFGLDKDKEWLKEQINTIISYIYKEKEINKSEKLEYVNYVFRWIKSFDLEEEFDIKELVEKLIIKERFVTNISWIKYYDLDKDRKWLKEQVQKMINMRDFEYAYDFINYFNLYRDKKWLKEQIQKIINEERSDVALFFIYKFGFEKEFDIKKLIEILIDEKYFTYASIYIKEFGLDEDKKWLKKLVQKIINQKEFVVASMFIEDFKLDPKEFGLK